MKYRIEKDGLGELEVQEDALWGIHTERANANFLIAERPINASLIHAFGMVKLACAEINEELGFLDSAKSANIKSACSAMINGKLDKYIIVDALQGGAGTSTNMNVNEVIANSAILKMNGELGDYSLIHPIEDINLHQSTNDTYPTALKIASINKIRDLEKNIVTLVESCQKKEKEYADVVKIARTQMQDAVLTTMGRSFAAFADAFSRDRWRIYKCEERMRVINLGGTAIGTGLSAPRQYIFKVSERIKQISGIGLARAENLVDATQNCDEFVEVSGILKAMASNLLKIANDIRIMSSGPTAGIGEISLSAKQAGSSIMPSKVNPVIPETVIQAAIKVISNDSALTTAVSMGNLELNAFMPLIADTLLESLDLLNNASLIFAKCINELSVNRKKCSENVNASTATLTALIAKIGYKEAEEISCEARKTDKTVREIILDKNILTEEEFNKITGPETVMQLGTKNKT